MALNPIKCRIFRDARKLKTLDISMDLLVDISNSSASSYDFRIISCILLTSDRSFVSIQLESTTF